MDERTKSNVNRCFSRNGRSIDRQSGIGYGHRNSVVFRWRGGHCWHSELEREGNERRLLEPGDRNTAGVVREPIFLVQVLQTPSENHVRESASDEILVTI